MPTQTWPATLTPLNLFAKYSVFCFSCTSAFSSRWSLFFHSIFHTSIPFVKISSISCGSPWWRTSIKHDLPLKSLVSSQTCICSTSPSALFSSKHHLSWGTCASPLPSWHQLDGCCGTGHPQELLYSSIIQRCSSIMNVSLHIFLCCSNKILTSLSDVLYLIHVF